MGGGGFSMEPDNPMLDDFLLSLAPAERMPRVCFVPTASGDSVAYIDSFHTAFPPTRAQSTVLSLFQRTIDDLAGFLCEQDIVYVGGGSTVNLLAVWRAHGLDVAMRTALDAGVVLAGISAGMNCWFEMSVTDSFNTERLAPLPDGLGLLPGSGCPHYDGEAQRRPTYTRLVAEGFAAGYGVDNSCALLFEDGVLADAVSSTESAGAYHVSYTDGRVIEQRLAVRFLGSAAPT